MKQDPQAGTSALVLTDFQELVKVLDECERRKLVLGAVAVGSIKIAFATPAGAPEPTPAKKLSVDEQELLQLRKKSRETFGRVLPDEELLAMKGTL